MRVKLLRIGGAAQPDAVVEETLICGGAPGDTECATARPAAVSCSVSRKSVSRESSVALDFAELRMVTGLQGIMVGCARGFARREEPHSTI